MDGWTELNGGVPPVLWDHGMTYDEICWHLDEPSCCSRYKSNSKSSLVLSDKVPYDLESYFFQERRASFAEDVLEDVAGNLDVDGALLDNEKYNCSGSTKIQTRYSDHLDPYYEYMFADAGKEEVTQKPRSGELDLERFGCFDSESSRVDSFQACLPTYESVCVGVPMLISATVTNVEAPEQHGLIRNEESIHENPDVSCHKNSSYAVVRSQTESNEKAVTGIPHQPYQAAYVTAGHSSVSSNSNPVAPSRRDDTTIDPKEFLKTTTFINSTRTPQNTHPDKSRGDNVPVASFTIADDSHRAFQSQGTALNQEELENPVSCSSQNCALTDCEFTEVKKRSACSSLSSRPLSTLRNGIRKKWTLASKRQRTESYSTTRLTLQDVLEHATLRKARVSIAPTTINKSPNHLSTFDEDKVATVSRSAKGYKGQFEIAVPYSAARHQTSKNHAKFGRRLHPNGEFTNTTFILDPRHNVQDFTKDIFDDDFALFATVLYADKKLDEAASNAVAALRSRSEENLRREGQLECATARLEGVPVGMYRYYQGHLTVEEYKDARMCICWDTCFCNKMCTIYGDIICPCNKFIVLEQD